MKTVPITPSTSGKARLHGAALASVIIALMLSLLLEALDQTIVGSTALFLVGSGLSGASQTMNQLRGCVQRLSE
jgi:hypothetical protein